MMTFTAEALDEIMTRHTAIGCLCFTVLGVWLGVSVANQKGLPPRAEASEIEIIEFLDMPWITYKQHQRHYAINMENIIALADETTARNEKSTYFYTPGNVFRADISMEEFDRVWDIFHAQKLSSSPPSSSASPQEMP